MKPVEAERLLGGYATGTLSEAERKTLFAAALDHQDLFDAVMDEEALRELLADPAAKAQLLTALASAAPKVVRFYRRPGLMGAAASLIVAATAGLAYLRSPEGVPQPMKQEEAKVPTVTSVAVPAEAPAPPAPARKVAPVAPLKGAAMPVQMVEAPAPAPPPQMMAAPAAAMEDSAGMRTQGELRRAEAQDNLAKKAIGGVGMNAAVPRTPTWRLDAQPDGSTRVTVKAPKGPQVVLLRRGATGIEVLKVRATEDAGNSRIQWQVEVRLGEGDVLDLYVLNAPTADPARLPETGLVDGFRARIHPAGK